MLLLTCCFHKSILPLFFYSLMNVSDIRDYNLGHQAHFYFFMKQNILFHSKYMSICGMACLSNKCRSSSESRK